MRYHAAKPPTADFKSAARDLVPTKLAAALWDRLGRYKSSLNEFPQTETCELVIVDRSIDAVSFLTHICGPQTSSSLVGYNNLVGVLFYSYNSGLLKRALRIRYLDGSGIEFFFDMSKGMEVLPSNFAIVYAQLSSGVSTLVLKDVIPP